MSQASLIPTTESPFVFQSHTIRTIMQDDQPWFVARDVCAALNIAWRGNTLSAIPAEWTCMRNLRMIQQNRSVKLVSEPAVYKLAFRSNKPEADAFTNWIASEVVPSIRKTGKYEAQIEPTSGELLPSHQAQLKAIVDAKVGMLPSEVQRKAYGEIWSRFSRHFQIARYQQLPSEKMGEAVAYLVEMQISERKSLPQNEQVPAVIKRIDETPFIELAQEIQTAHEAVERILSPLQHKISSLSYFVSKELGKQADIQITCIQDMDIRNCLWGYLSSSLLSEIREAMVYPSRHLEPYANPGYSLLGIVKQLNSARE